MTIPNVSPKQHNKQITPSSGASQPTVWCCPFTMSSSFVPSHVAADGFLTSRFFAASFFFCSRFFLESDGITTHVHTSQMWSYSRYTVHNTTLTWYMKSNFWCRYQAQKICARYLLSEFRWQLEYPCLMWMVTEQGCQLYHRHILSVLNRWQSISSVDDSHWQLLNTTVAWGHRLPAILTGSL